MTTGAVMRRLGDLLEVQNGYAFDSQSFSPTAGTPLIRIRDLKGGTATETRYGGAFDPVYLVHAGDLLVGMDGEFACYEWRGDPALLNQRVCRLRGFSSDLLPRYLFYGINEHLKDIEDMTGFATVKHLSSKSILNIQMPIPPRPEQERIVGILEETFAAIAIARANTEQKLRNARQLFEGYINRVFTERGERWADRPFGAVCRFVRGPFGGSLKKSMFVPDGYAVYEQSHAISDQFTNIRYFIDERKFSEMRRFEVHPNDIIMSCAGTLGRTAIVPTGVRRGIINQALLRLTPTNDILSTFLKYWMESKSFQDSLDAQAAGAAIRNVASVKVLKDIRIPVPPLAEQRLVEETLRQASSAAEELVAVTLRKLSALDELKQSLLHEAFAGAL